MKFYKPRRHELLEERRLLAADLVVESDFSILGVHDDEVTRVVRIYNNGDESADNTHVNIRLNSELRAIEWSRERGLTKTVSLESADATDIVFEGTTSDQFLGRQFEPIGDINGDGTTDFLLNWRYVVYGDSNSDVYSIHPETLDGTNGFTVISDSFVQKLGDINEDGFDDLSFGPHVLLGAETGTMGSDVDLWQLDPAAGFTVEGADGVYAVGDANNDGRIDLALRMKDTGFHYLLWDIDEVTSDGVVEQAEILDDRSIGIRLQGAFQDAGPAGDLNNDGIADVVFSTRHDVIKASVLFGRSDFSNEIPNLIEMSNEQGFVVHDLLDTRTGFLAGAQVAGAGDVNADGIDDIQITFEGTMDCFCTSSDKDRFPVAGGTAIVFGSSDIAVEGYLNEESNMVMLDVIVPFNDARPETTIADINGDNVNDIAMQAGRSTYVVFGGTELASHDFGQANSEYAGFNGQNGFRVDELLTLADVNGDSRLDAIRENSTAMVNTKQLAGHVTIALDPFAELQIISDSTTGDWNISETVDIPSGTSLIYTAHASVRRDPSSIVSYAVESVGLHSPPTATVDQSTLTGLDLFDKTFQVSFESPEFDKNTVGDADVEILMPDGSRQITPFVNSLSHGPTGVVAVYQLPFYNGWTDLDGHIFEIWMRPDEVTGNGGQAIPAARLTAFAVDLPDESTMTVKMTTPDGMISARSKYPFLIRLEYESEIPFERFFRSGEIYVELPDGRISYPSPHSIGVNETESSLVLNYELWDSLSEEGDARWDTFDNGEYKIYLADSQIKDVAGHELAGQFLGTLNVDILADTEPPEATAFAFDLMRDRIGGHKIKVTYSDNDRLARNTISQGDIAVLQPNGELVEPIFRGLDETMDNTAIYRLPAPGGTWDSTDDGEYQIMMQPNQVFDKNQNSVASQLLYTFTIQIDDETLLGDVDGNRRVDFADFLVLSQNFGKEVDQNSDGDIDGDGFVSFTDFLALSQNFGRILPS